jgi:hypothetical protein
LASFFSLELQPLSAVEDVKYADYVQQYFWRENNKGLIVHAVLEYSALFLFLITTLHGDISSGMKYRQLRKFPPSPQLI